MQNETEGWREKEKKMLREFENLNEKLNTKKKKILNDIAKKDAQDQRIVAYLYSNLLSNKSNRINNSEDILKNSDHIRNNTMDIQLYYTLIANLYLLGRS